MASRSNQNLDIEEIAETYNYREQSLTLYFSALNPNYTQIFYDYTKNEIQQQFEIEVLEAERDAALNLLAAIEALFRVDYIIRSQEKDKTTLTKNFRALFATYGHRISLEDSIFEEWKQSGLIKPSIISELKGAFKYRHWLAHGRYWVLKSGRKYYDFYYLYNLASQVNLFPFKKK